MADSAVNAPRPPNEFILFRQHIVKEIKEMIGDKPQPTQKQVSTFSSKLWKEIVPPAVKQYFRMKAKEASALHKKAHPGYKFRPNRKKGKGSNKRPKDEVPWYYTYYNKSRSPAPSEHSDDDDAGGAQTSTSSAEDGSNGVLASAPASWPAVLAYNLVPVYGPYSPLPLHWIAVPAQDAGAFPLVRSQVATGGQHEGQQVVYYSYALPTTIPTSPGPSLSSAGRGDEEGTADSGELESTKKEDQDDSDLFEPEYSDTPTSSGTSDGLSTKSERGESDFSMEDYFSFSDYEGEDE
ncbi:hypothetical protein CVT26_007705 [Gymnopilus dilepis]|uniref:HMG box domain-containing protein n=1 Tax=Gymnopilus dilepis TaxID=231916 RepID=A0A409WIL3_9AGAR|nr:hypothetical protein CVT26_007705 [Gymnopilus dilepis]